MPLDTDAQPPATQSRQTEDRVHPYGLFLSQPRPTPTVEGSGETRSNPTAPFRHREKETESPNLNETRTASPAPSAPPRRPRPRRRPLGKRHRRPHNEDGGDRGRGVLWPALEPPSRRVPHLRKAVSNTEASRPRETVNSWGQMGWLRGQDGRSVKRKRPTDSNSDGPGAHAAPPSMRLLRNLAAETGSGKGRKDGRKEGRRKGGRRKERARSSHRLRFLAMSQVPLRSTLPLNHKTVKRLRDV